MKGDGQCTPATVREEVPLSQGRKHGRSRHNGALARAPTRGHGKSVCFLKETEGGEEEREEGEQGEEEEIRRKSGGRSRQRRKKAA